MPCGKTVSISAWFVRSNTIENIINNSTYGGA